MYTLGLHHLAKISAAFLWISSLSSCHHHNAGPPSIETLTRQGDAVASYNLGEQYANMEGTEKHKAAVLWLRKSANQGIADAL